MLNLHTIHTDKPQCRNTGGARGEGMRQRLNVSLTDEGLAILDQERGRMGLSRSAFMEVLLRFWVRDQSAPAQSVESLSADEGGRSDHPRLRMSKK